jgi:hypothetical protein
VATDSAPEVRKEGEKKQNVIQNMDNDSSGHNSNPIVSLHVKL